jgi:hypothetical protein
MVTFEGWDDIEPAERHASSRIPTAIWPIPVGSRLRTTQCFHCAGPLGVSTWTRWNGFLVVCPHCRGVHGKPWSPQRTIVAGFLLNAASFPFVLRPRAAVAALSGFGLLCWVLLTLAVRHDEHSAPLIVFLLTFLFGPAILNALVLIRHQVKLEKPAPPRPSR